MSSPVCEKWALSPSPQPVPLPQVLRLPESARVSVGCSDAASALLITGRRQRGWSSHVRLCAVGTPESERAVLGVPPPLCPCDEIVIAHAVAAVARVVCRSPHVKRAPQTLGNGFAAQMYPHVHFS